MELGVSLRTIKTHRARVMQKTGAISVAELVGWRRRRALRPRRMVPRDHRRQPAKYRTLVPALGFASGADPMPQQSLESICIVDDDASVRHSIEQLLDSDGLRAQSFEDAEDFLAHAHCHAVSLAVLDVWMLDTSGLQVQARLREVSPDTKVIMMTGRETPAIRAAALAGGAFAFFVKPFDDEAFLSLVRQALRFAA